MAASTATVDVRVTIKRAWQVKLGALLIVLGFPVVGERVAMHAIKITTEGWR